MERVRRERAEGAEAEAQEGGELFGVSPIRLAARVGLRRRRRSGLGHRGHDRRGPGNLPAHAQVVPRSHHARVLHRVRPDDLHSVRHAFEQGWGRVPAAGVVGGERPTVPVVRRSQGSGHEYVVAPRRGGREEHPRHRVRGRGGSFMVDCGRPEGSREARSRVLRISYERRRRGRGERREVERARQHRRRGEAPRLVHAAKGWAGRVRGGVGVRDVRAAQPGGAAPSGRATWTGRFE